MNQITITHAGNGTTHQMDRDDIESFERELSRTAWWRSLSGIIKYILGRDKYVSPQVAADAIITVVSPRGSRKEWRILGRTVLEEASSGRKRQFYMGVYLLEKVGY